jgi:type II secretory pathway pseudopilin PulG
MKLSDKGLSLLELMVTVGILAIVISGLLLTLVSCILLNQSNSNLVIAANDAQYALEQIKNLDYNDIDDYDPPAFNNLQNEDIIFTHNIGTEIATITINVTWTERQRQRSFVLSTYIAP